MVVRGRKGATIAATIEDYEDDDRDETAAIGAASHGSQERYRGQGPVGVSKHMTRAKLEELFDLPMEAAANSLGVSTTIIKRLCRKHGVPKWPYRQLCSVDKDIEKTSRSINIARRSGSDPEGIQTLVSHLDDLRWKRSCIISGKKVCARPHEKEKPAASSTLSQKKSSKKVPSKSSSKTPSESRNGSKRSRKQSGWVDMEESSIEADAASMWDFIVQLYEEGQKLPSASMQPTPPAPPQYRLLHRDSTAREEAPDHGTSSTHHLALAGAHTLARGFIRHQQAWAGRGDGECGPPAANTDRSI
jgi:hypothetical protein